MVLERAEAEKIVKENVNGQFLFNHMLATEAIMRGCAKFLGEDEDKWALCGLLHDIDFEKTKDDPIKHGVLGVEILKEKDVPEEILTAILAHNYMNPDAPARTTKMDHMLVAADAMTGLVVACAMVKEKKIENVSEKTIKKAFKKKGFAAGSKREMIMECETAGIPYEKLVEISLEAMKGISEELGL
ncbi:MAG: HDIG domain-containing protein [Candidatus Aenigmarchaeota archaeon]|nr:HDIG domain-containing protein [Candidatus Aenigmarchaeota archaeon]